MIHKVPQGSFQNRFENTSSNEARWISVEAKNPPSSLRFEKQAITIDEIKPRGEAIAPFTFAINPGIPVGTDYTLLFVIRSQSGEVWNKEIHLVIVRQSMTSLTREVVATGLREEGFEVIEARDGKTGADLATNPSQISYSVMLRCPVWTGLIHSNQSEKIPQQQQHPMG